jgi:hypothetical protein
LRMDRRSARRQHACQRNQERNRTARNQPAGQVRCGTCPAVDQNLSVLEIRKSLG